MKAISLWQPWASLLVTPQPCGLCSWGEQHTAERHSMVKRIETRSWPCPPKLIGQRIAFHAAKRKPEHLSNVGEWTVHVAPYVTGGPQLRRLGAVHNGQLTGAPGTVVPLPLGAIVGSGVVTASLPIGHTHSFSTGIVEGESPPTAGLDVIVNHRPLTDSLILDRWQGGVEDISDQLPYGDFTPGRWAWIISDAAPCEPIPFKGRQGFFNLPDDIAAKFEAAP